DEHRQRRLAGAGVAHQPEAAAGLEVGLHVVDPAAHELDHHRRDFGADRRPLEGDALELAGDDRGDAAVAAAAQARFAALAGAGLGVGVVEDPAGAVADAEWAWTLAAERLAAGDRRHQKSGPAATGSGP